jgi:hypothetical protein
VGEITGEIERQIIAERRELGRSLDELETKAKALTNWRTHYRSHPRIALGAVFATGLVAGALAGRRRHVLTDDLLAAEGIEPVRHLTANGPAPRSRTKEQLASTWGHIWSSLLGVAATRAVDAVNRFLPGFREEYSHRNPGEPVTAEPWTVRSTPH